MIKHWLYLTLRPLKAAIPIIGVLACIPYANASFIANFHDNLSSGNNVLFVFGADGTAGTISGNDGFLQAFTIDASGVFEQSVGFAGREMSVNGAVNNFSLFVNSADPISGIALNRAPFTTDQTNLLDIDGLGTGYIVLSIQGTAGQGSQFSVTATEDNTTVTIESPIALAGNAANTPFDVTLQQGESIFYNSGNNGDVSGTRVTATSDVAVFAGAECTNVPAGVTFCDHLISQQFSTDNFDTEFQIVENFGGGADADLVRILAAEDNTEVFLDGVSQGIINSGEFIQIDGVGNSVITASAPVTVGQFIRGQSGTRTTGDPAFAIIPSVDQLLSSYVFTTPVGSDAFLQNFLNIGIDVADAGSLLLNGALVDTSGFDLINGILYGNIAIGQGIGTVSADNPFLATTSGFSNFDSFFNPIATSFSTGVSPDPDPDPTPVPEPGTASLLGLGLLGILGGMRNRRRRIRG